MDNLSAHNASEYDLKVRQTIPFYEQIHAEAIDVVRAAHPDPKCWVDSGCGTGSFVEQALKAFPNTRFILADPAEAMLAQAQTRLGQSSMCRVSILPPIDSGSLTSRVQPGVADVVTAIQCHHYLQPEARRHAVQSCFDALAPEGVFLAFENVAPRTPEGTRIGLKRWQAFQIASGRSPEEAEKHLARYGTEFFPIPVEQHLELLAQIGFRTIELFWFSHMQAGWYGIK